MIATTLAPLPESTHIAILQACMTNPAVLRDAVLLAMCEDGVPLYMGPPKELAVDEGRTVLRSHRISAPRDGVVILSAFLLWPAGDHLFTSFAEPLRADEGEAIQFSITMAGA